MLMKNCTFAKSKALLPPLSNSIQIKKLGGGGGGEEQGGGGWVGGGGGYGEGDK